MSKMNNETVFLPLWSCGCQQLIPGNLSPFDAPQEYPQRGPQLCPGPGDNSCFKPL
jgi:hypothetical protein